MHIQKKVWTAYEVHISCSHQEASFTYCRTYVGVLYVDPCVAAFPAAFKADSKVFVNSLDYIRL